VNQTKAAYQETIYEPGSRVICAVNAGDEGTCGELKKEAYTLPAPTRLLRCPQRGQVLWQAGAILLSTGLFKKAYKPCYV